MENNLKVVSSLVCKEREEKATATRYEVVKIPELLQLILKKSGFIFLGSNTKAALH